MRDEDFLKQISEPVTQADIPVADDLLETLIAHKDGCVGMQTVYSLFTAPQILSALPGR